ncbi:hypothetical protein B0H21DRAFT_101053 [Amylocystis lapponica]|nr:hypothetical protein B0H21DRAFT_101053 [Amylocystis lapponica]
MPPTSPFDNFRFTTIGQEPDLLKRITEPRQEVAYRSPSPSIPTESPRTDTVPLSRPSLLEALGAAEFTSPNIHLHSKGHIAPTNSGSTIAGGPPKKVVSNEIFAVAPLSASHTTSHPTPSAAPTSTTTTSSAVSQPSSFHLLATSTIAAGAFVPLPADAAMPAQELPTPSGPAPAAVPSPDLYALVSQRQERALWDDLRDLRAKCDEEIRELLARNDETIRAAQREKDQAVRVASTVESALDKMESLRAHQEQRWAAEQSKAEHVAAEARRLLEEKKLAEEKRVLEERRRAEEEAAVAEAKHQAEAAAAAERRQAEEQQRLKAAEDAKRKAAEEKEIRKAAAAAAEEKRRAAAEEKHRHIVEEAKRKAERAAEDAREQRRKDSEEEQRLRREKVLEEKNRAIEENAIRARAEKDALLKARLEKEKSEAKTTTVSPPVSISPPAPTSNPSSDLSTSRPAQLQTPVKALPQVLQAQPLSGGVQVSVAVSSSALAMHPRCLHIPVPNLRQH